MIYAKALREKLAKLSLDMHAIVDKAKNDSNRGLTSDEAEQFDNLEAEYAGVESSITRAEKADKIGNDLRTVDPDQIRQEIDGGDPKAAAARNKDLHNKAFAKYLRNGIEALDAEERQFMAQQFVSNAGTGIRNAAQSTTPGTAGGYLVPTGFSDQLEEAMLWFGGIDGTVGQFTTENGAPLPWPTDNDTTQMGRILTQNTQLTNTAIVFSEVMFNSYIFTSDSVLVPLSLIQDSYFDLDAYIARKLGTRLGRLFNNKMTIGAGTTEPTGIVTAAVAAGSKTTGAAGQTTSIIYDDLVNLEHLVDPSYRPNGKYMFHDSTLKVLKKLKDSANRPLWQPALTASFGKGAEPSILDHPYVINNDMPVMAVNANSVLFGDLSKYKVRNVAGGTTIMRLVERYADYLQVGYLGFRRADGNLIDAGTHPVAVYANSAT